jgi:hypothetical protein
MIEDLISSLVAKVASLRAERDLARNGELNYAQTLEAISEALGQSETHFLCMAGDVAYLIQRVSTATEETRLLAKALVDIAVAAKIVDGKTPLSGPQILLLSSDVAGTFHRNPLQGVPELDAAEVATVLAALRHYQADGYGYPTNRPDDIRDIATNDNYVISLDSNAIDEL